MNSFSKYQPSGNYSNLNDFDDDVNLSVDDALINDLNYIWEMYPLLDRNFIYDMLWQVKDNPDRVNIIIDKMVVQEFDPLTTNPSINNRAITNHSITNQSMADMNQYRNSRIAQDCSADVIEVKQLKLDALSLRSAFPLCDPPHIYKRLVNYFSNPYRVQIVAQELAEHDDYPKLFDRLQQQRRFQQVKDYFNMQLDVEQFLLRFPDPIKEFTDETKVMPASYKAHLDPHLLNTFITLKPEFIRQTAKQHNFRLSTTTAALRLNHIYSKVC